METRIFIQVRTPYLTGNSPTLVGQSRYCSYSSESHKYNIWDNLSNRRRLSGMDNQLVVDDRVVFLLEYELGEIRDSTRSLLLASADTILGLSRLISDVDIWWRIGLLWLVCLVALWRVPSLPMGSCTYTHRYPLVQVELGRPIWIQSE